jgi:hypothetical protein
MIIFLTIVSMINLLYSFYIYKPLDMNSFKVKMRCLIWIISELVLSTIIITTNIGFYLKDTNIIIYII